MQIRKSRKNETNKEGLCTWEKELHTKTDRGGSLDPPPIICWCNTWTDGELLDDLYDTFQIVKIFFSIIIMNISRAFKEESAWFISLMIILRISQQYLLYVLTLPPFPFKVSACQHFSLDPPIPFQSASSVSILAHNTLPPPKRADVIFECSLTLIWVIIGTVLAPSCNMKLAKLSA